MNEWMNARIFIALWNTCRCVLNLPRLAENLTEPISKRKLSDQESMRSVQWVSMEKSMVEKTWGRGVFVSLRAKKRSDWWWKWWWWQCRSDMWRVVRRWKTKMWMMVGQWKNYNTVLHTLQKFPVVQWLGTCLEMSLTNDISLEYSEPLHLKKKLTVKHKSKCWTTVLFGPISMLKVHSTVTSDDELHYSDEVHWCNLF